jgi:hypothetical protein
VGRQTFLAEAKVRHAGCKEKLVQLKPGVDPTPPPEVVIERVLSGIYRASKF